MSGNRHGANMEVDAQVSQLEAALLRQAETLAREQRQNAESARERILKDAAERLKLAEDREVLSAKVDAERIVRREVQVAEARMAAELDRLRWALTEATLAGVQLAFAESCRRSGALCRAAGSLARQRCPGLAGRRPDRRSAGG